MTKSLPRISRSPKKDEFLPIYNFNNGCKTRQASPFAFLPLWGKKGTIQPEKVTTSSFLFLMKSPCNWCEVRERCGLRCTLQNPASMTQREILLDRPGIPHSTPSHPPTPTPPPHTHKEISKLEGISPATSAATFRNHSEPSTSKRDVSPPGKEQILRGWRGWNGAGE